MMLYICDLFSHEVWLCVNRSEEGESRGTTGHRSVTPLYIHRELVLTTPDEKSNRNQRNRRLNGGYLIEHIKIYFFYFADHNVDILHSTSSHNVTETGSAMRNG